MNDENFITILTPTFNRSEKLEKLYHSLMRQTRHGFVWLIVDDGSTDDTAERVSCWKEQTADSDDWKPEIRYVYQTNAGKHVAINHGIDLIDTCLTFIVDSDDYLTEDSVEVAEKYLAEYGRERESLKLAGFSFIRVSENGRVNNRLFPLDNEVDTFTEVRINRNLLGDKAEIFFTDIMKKYPFPQFHEERFLPEDAIWIRMSGPYKMVHANRQIYVCDYLKGGLTKSGRGMKMNSPYGMMYRSEGYLSNNSVRAAVQIKMMMLWQVYSHFAGQKYNGETIPDNCKVSHDFLYYLCLIPGIILYWFWKAEYGNKK